MISKRYPGEIKSNLGQIPERLPLTQFVGESNKFAIILRGDFHIPEEWPDGKTFWLGKQGQILIDCPLPEALIKLSFRIFPSKNKDLKLCVSQGNVILREDVILKSENYHLYISLLEGMNPVDLHVKGEVLSPNEVCGIPDGRKLSYALQNLPNIELLA